MSKKRLMEIETKIAFQEKTIKDLNDVLYEQQQEVEKLGMICNALAKRFKELFALIPETNTPKNERPPHY